MKKQDIPQDPGPLTNAPAQQTTILPLRWFFYKLNPDPHDGGISRIIFI
jgi:hypothetical protein